MTISPACCKHEIILRKYAKILRVTLAFEGASWYNQLIKKMRIYADLFRGANYGAGEKRVSSKAD